MGRLQSAANEANDRAKSLEASLASAKDQYLRLNADFDNFRRRTVGCGTRGEGKEGVEEGQGVSG